MHAQHYAKYSFAGNLVKDHKSINYVEVRGSLFAIGGEGIVFWDNQLIRALETTCYRKSRHIPRITRQTKASVLSEKHIQQKLINTFATIIYIVD